MLLLPLLLLLFLGRCAAAVGCRRLLCSSFPSGVLIPPLRRRRRVTKSQSRSNLVLPVCPPFISPRC